jgi:hypothetical protein
MKIDISVLKIIFESKKLIFQYLKKKSEFENVYLHSDFFQFNLKSLFECKSCYSNCETFYLNLKISISI